MCARGLSLSLFPDRPPLCSYYFQVQQKPTSLFKKKETPSEHPNFPFSLCSAIKQYFETAPEAPCTIMADRNRNTHEKERSTAKAIKAKLGSSEISTTKYIF